MGTQRAHAGSGGAMARGIPFGIEDLMADFGKLPTSRIGRMAGMAALGFKTGKSLLAGGGSEGVAGEAVKVLGSMRGIATKVGQMASYVDGVIPEQHREAFETAMATLRSQAPKSSPAQIRSAIKAEFGQTVDKLFAEWSDEPFASASIGQVHRARLHDGRDVVVKVQHPGIEKAMTSDLENLSMFEALGANFGGRKYQSAEYLETVRSRFMEELDYRLEAQRMELFRKAHAGDAQVRVPVVVSELSSKRVLTTEFAPGLSFEQACAAPEDQRRAWALTLWRFVMRGLVESGVLNADPHPGNYIFQEDGAITFIDFGCCEVLDDGKIGQMQRIYRSAIEEDWTTFKKEFAIVAQMKPGRMGDVVMDIAMMCFSPVAKNEEFHFTRKFVARIVEESNRLSYLAVMAPKEELFTGPPELLFINRLQFGFFSILARLDVSANYRRETLACLPIVRTAKVA
jgi:predicted unusual protein kinase regulating ubiquinone biosynthesis (AarF/ABC1/UbiB family)